MIKLVPGLGTEVRAYYNNINNINQNLGLVVLFAKKRIGIISKRIVTLQKTPKGLSHCKGTSKGLSHCKGTSKGLSHCKMDSSSMNYVLPWY
jgi:hypothetical protein